MEIREQGWSMRAVYCHLVSTAQNHGCNHGDDAMPCGKDAIKQCDVEVDGIIGRTPGAHHTFTLQNPWLQKRSAVPSSFSGRLIGDSTWCGPSILDVVQHTGLPL